MAKRTIGTGDLTSWKPQPGDRLIGEIVRRDEVDTQYGSCGVLEIDDQQNGVTTVFCGSTILQRVYADVELGNVLDLTYEGEKTSEKTGRTFKSYVAEVDDGKP
jgi:hypothetical protein